MMGKPQKHTPKLFYVNVNLADRVPQDHFLRRVGGKLFPPNHVRNFIHHSCRGLDTRQRCDLV